MKKSISMVICALVLIGCSSSSNTEELEELNNDLISENNTPKSELNTPENTPTDPYADLTFDDFNPECVVTKLDSVGTLYYEVSITNLLDDRSTYQLSIDILYKNNWVVNATDSIRNIPSGIRGTTESLRVGITDGRSQLLSDYKCEIVFMRIPSEARLINNS